MSQSPLLQVVFFSPKVTDSGLDSWYYSGLARQVVAAVQGLVTEGDWPVSDNYGRCGQGGGDAQGGRGVDLVSAFKVLFYLNIWGKHFNSYLVLVCFIARCFHIRVKRCWLHGL